MNWEHLRAFLWLHSRLRANKSKRASKLSNTLYTILQIIAVIAAIGAFCGALAAGMYLLRATSAPVVLFAWDGLIAVFLFAWMLALFVDLQRSELLPLEKFMQYPISVSGLFLINYVAAILSEHATVFFFIPAMLGLSVGLVISRGASMLLVFPLVAAFILMVTAITHQFRGWLAVLMLNKRHRRTVITIVTITMILMFQLPGISARMFGSRRRGTTSIMASEAGREQVKRTVTLASMVLPVGWLPYGAMASAEGRFLPPVLGMAGMALIGVISLRRSYRTTVRLYTGNYGTGRTKKTTAGLPKPVETIVPEIRSDSVSRPASRTFLELKLPWVSEQASAVALTTFRSFTRAPESKMLLLSPVIMILFFGTSVGRISAHPAEYTRPLIASGVLMMIFFTMIGLATNHFAFDRSGFRNFVLSSCNRRDILLGKNLALVPLTLGLASLVLIFLQWVFPMRIDHFIAVVFQMITMFLLYCLFANFVAIFNPVAMAAGSFRPAVRLSGKTLLFSLAMLFLFPLSQVPSMIPLAVEYGVHWMGWYTGVPVFLVLSIIEAVLVASVYWTVLDQEGRFLQSRELKILDIVAAHGGEG